MALLKCYALIWGLLLANSYPNAWAADANPQVTTKNGTIEGHYLKTENGRSISAFEGVPYAKSPVGKLRFEPPQSAESWTGVKSAKVPTICLQYMHSRPVQHPNEIKGQEDCLHLNIYKPADTTKVLDIIVYIHGGAYMFNYGGSYRPIYLLDKDIMLITINYRLGPFGFLSTEDAVSPGNNGLRDQIMALKWIQENIGAFGGNPGSVTIAGNSAGGASVTLHTLMSQSKDLFHKGISESGVVANPWVLAENLRDKTRKIGAMVGCNDTDDSKKLIDCLKAKPGKDIIATMSQFIVWLYNPFSPFAPTIDKWSSDPLLPEHPLQIIDNGKLNDVPIIFSFVVCEGLYPGGDYLYEDKYLDELDAQWNKLLPCVLDYNYTLPIEKHNEIAEKIRNAYDLKDTKITRDSFRKVLDMMSDRLFKHEIVEVAQKYARKFKSPVYAYEYAYMPHLSNGDMRAGGRKIECTSHSDDLLVILPYPGADMHSVPEDKKMSNVMVNIWATFAGNGHPTVENVDWQPLPKQNSDINKLHYLLIESSEQMRMTEKENIGRPQFWDSIGFKENENLLDK